VEKVPDGSEARTSCIYVGLEIQELTAVKAFEQKAKAYIFFRNNN